MIGFMNQKFFGTKFAGVLIQLNGYKAILTINIHNTKHKLIAHLQVNIKAPMLKVPL